MNNKTLVKDEINSNLKTAEELLKLMDKVFLIIKLSFEGTDPDERHLIEKLTQMNGVAEQMLKNLRELIEISYDLSEAIPDVMSREYAKVILKKISLKIDTIYNENNAFKQRVSELTRHK